MSIPKNLRFGRAYVHVTGVGYLASMPGASCDLSGVEKTPVMGIAGRLEGFSEASKPSHLKCRVSLGVGDDLGALKAIKNATATFECDTGQVFVIRGATLINTLVLEASGAGNVDIELMGSPAEQVQAATQAA